MFPRLLSYEGLRTIDAQLGPPVRDIFLIMDIILLCMISNVHISTIQVMSMIFFPIGLYFAPLLHHCTLVLSNDGTPISFTLG